MAQNKVQGAQCKVFGAKQLRGSPRLVENVVATEHHHGGQIDIFGCFRLIVSRREEVGVLDPNRQRLVSRIDRLEQHAIRELQSIVDFGLPRGESRVSFRLELDRHSRFA